MFSEAGPHTVLHLLGYIPLLEVVDDADVVDFATVLRQELVAAQLAHVPLVTLLLTMLDDQVQRVIHEPLPAQELSVLLDGAI